MSVIKTSKIVHPDAPEGGVILRPDGTVALLGGDGEGFSEYATEDYVDSEIARAVEDLATENYVDSEIAGATTGLASETFVEQKIEEASPIGLILALGG